MSNRANRILIFYSSLGSGHFSAADAIRDALVSSEPNVEVRVVDAFPRSMKEGFVQDTMTILSSQVFPGIYNHIWRNGWFKTVYDAFYSIGEIHGHVIATVRETSPDVVLCTQSIPCSILAKEKQINKYRLIAVATDFGFHHYWPREGVHSFCVASNSDREKLASEGIPIDDVHVTGIPIRNPQTGYSAPGLQNQLRVLVVVGGGKTAPYRSIQPLVFRILDLALNGDHQDIEWAFVFGNNHRAKENAKAMTGGKSMIQIMGFIPDLPRLLWETDIVIAKPGGLIIAEALASGAAIGLLNRGAGQERANADFVINGEAALYLGDSRTAPTLLESLIRDRESVQRMRNKSKNLGNPNAAVDIVKIVLRSDRLSE